MCELIESTVTEDHLEQLVSDCEFQESSSLDDANVVTPFELELLRHIQELENLPHPLLLCLAQKSSMVGMAALVKEIPSFRDHEDFLDLFPRGERKIMSVGEAARKNLSSLLTLRKQTNVTLTTADGGEERCHLEVLITRSKFIRGMMRFEGKEYHSCLETKKIRIEDMSHAALQAWLVLCYGSEFHEMDQLSIYDLLSLLVKSHMHQENWCQQIITLLQKEIDKKETTEIPSLLLEIGSQLLDLPKMYQDQFVQILELKHGNFSLDLRALIDHSMNFAQKVKDLVFENERLRRELSEERGHRDGDDDGGE